MTRRFLLPLAAVVAALPLVADDKPRYAGPTADGFLLPNGWTLTPVGRHVVLPDMPLNVLPFADGKRALVGTSGFNQHELAVVDLDGPSVAAVAKVRQSWFGLAADAKQERVWWSGGGTNVLHTFQLQDGKPTRVGPPEPDRSKLTRDEREKQKGFRTGLCIDAKQQVLFTLDIDHGTLEAQRLADGEVIRTLSLGGKPYDVIANRAGTMLFVSDWAGRQVLAVKIDDFRVIGRVAVGEHPNQMALHPKDDRLFVACASTNNVSVIDTKRGVVTETIFTALFPRSPEGSTPDAVAVSPDGQTLYVANADNNCVAVIDIAERDRSQVKGFIPTGWYPTAVAVTPDGKNLLVGVGKGLQSKANPPTPGALAKYKAKATDENEDAKVETWKRLPYPYIGTTMSGALSVVSIPDEKTLRDYTAKVYRNCPYSDMQLSAAPHPVKTAIPTKVGDPSPIKHVIYVIKENRTYDQVFGDMKRGNGDPSLVMFGPDVTPNHRKLAEEFVLLDNLYCNGQVSRDGHPWSTQAYHTDYIARDWHLTYSRRKGVNDDEAGNLRKGPSGHIWDAAARAGLRYRNYGEGGKRVSTGDGLFKIEASEPSLIGHICPDYGVATKKGQKIRDTDRVEVFLREFRDFVAKGELPHLMTVSLPEDHTTGTTVDTFTPPACVASNDLALGKLVEAVSKSPAWKETAIFVIEDDAQNGPDHVDAQRTVGLVISPYTKRNHLDSSHYSTVSMIRTIELILGLPPLSQYDAAARPMFESFTDTADLRPYAHVPAKIDLNATNTRLAYGAERSGKMDFSEVDLIDDFELNEILWRAIKGADAPLPPAVRRAIAFRSQPIK